MRNLFYWFNTTGKGTPQKAALIKTDGSLIPLDLSSYMDTRKVTEIPAEERFGFVLERPVDGAWTGEAFSAYLGRAVRVGYGGLLKTAEAASVALHAAWAQEEASERAIQLDPEAHLDRELGRHDWFSAMSDAPGVALAGGHHWKKIKDLMGQVPTELARSLFFKHAPEEAVCPF